MRRSLLVAPLLVLLAFWLVARRTGGDGAEFAGPRAASEWIVVGESSAPRLEARDVHSAAERRAAREDSAPAPAAPPAPTTLRVQLSQRTSWRGVRPPLGRVLVWATAPGKRGLDVVATAVDVDGWTEVEVPLPEGADRVHAVWEEPGWTSSVESLRLEPNGRPFLQLSPRVGSTLRGELVDSRGRPERDGEVLLALAGDDSPDRGDEGHVEHGEFRLMIRESGTHELRARGEAGQARRILELDLDRPPPPVVLVLEGGGRLTGRLLDPRGEPAAYWPLVVAAEGDALDRLRREGPPRLAEDDHSQPGRAWSETVTGPDGSFEFRGLRTGVFSVLSGPWARAAPGLVLAERVVPPVDGLALRVPVAWTEIVVVDARGEALRFDPHEAPGAPVREGADTDVYVLVERGPGTRVSSRAWRAADGPRWSVLLEAGVGARASVWSPERRLAVTELLPGETPPAIWTVRAGPQAETAWLLVRPVGLPESERALLAFTIIDVESGVAVDGDVFREAESVEVGLAPGRYEVRIFPGERRSGLYASAPLPWSGEVTLAPGEERTLEAAPERRSRLDVTWHFVEDTEEPSSTIGREQRAMNEPPFELHLAPVSHVSGGTSRTLELGSRMSVDLVPGTWTLRLSSAAGHRADAVVEVELGKVTRVDLEVAGPR